MYEFGDEVIINSYRIPWLIWIQLLAMLLLLLILLYSFTDDDFSLNFTTADSPPSATALRRNSKYFNSITEVNKTTWVLIDVDDIDISAFKGPLEPSEGPKVVDDKLVISKMEK